MCSLNGWMQRLLLSLSLSVPIFAAGQQPGQAGQSKIHVIKTGPNTIEWGYFDGSQPAIVHIDSGDIVEIESPLDCAKSLQEVGAPEQLISATARELDTVPQKDRGPGPNILVGPIAVNGAEPGDVLEVKILELYPAENFAENLFPPNLSLAEDLPRAKVRFIPLDKSRKVALFAPGIEIPLHPFFGTMGVAPAGWLGRINDAAPDYIGGNLDNKALVEGAILYLPISNSQAHCSALGTVMRVKETERWTVPLLKSPFTEKCN